MTKDFIQTAKKFRGNGSLSCIPEDIKKDFPDFITRCQQSQHGWYKYEDINPELFWNLCKDCETNKEWFVAVRSNGSKKKTYGNYEICYNWIYRKNDNQKFSIL